MAVEEEQHYLTGKYLLPAKVLLRLASESLVSMGVIEKISDCYFLTIDEILCSLRGKSPYLGLLIDKRREETVACGVRVPMTFPLDAVPPLNPATRFSSTLSGTPMNQGIAQGVVCIAEDFEQTKGIVPGSILVTRTPNPTLVPLYPVIGGLVTCSGEPLSAGMVAAREYSIPAISGISMEHLAKFAGKKVHMNGATGEIILIEEAGPHSERLP
jgi:phosphohistidine swiveling domain-containing protein